MSDDEASSGNMNDDKALSSDGCWGAAENDAAHSQAVGDLPQVLVVAAALLDVDNRVLLAQRPPGKSMAGLWEFPGGKVGLNETPEAALIRELDEELGIEVEVGRVLELVFARSTDEVSIVLIFFEASRTTRSAAPRPIEAAAVRWVELHDLLDGELTPGDRVMAAQLRSRAD